MMVLSRISDLLDSYGKVYGCEVVLRFWWFYVFD